MEDHEALMEVVADLATKVQALEGVLEVATSRARALRRARPRSLKVPGGFIGRSSILGVDQAIQVRTESLLRRRMRRARCRSRSPASKSPAMGKRFFGDWLSKAIPKRASSSRPVGAPKSEGWVVCLDHPM